MKSTLLSAIIFTGISGLFFSCDKDEPPGTYFPPNQLMSLKISNLESFWEDEVIESVTPSVIECFDNYPGHLSSIRYVSEKYNMIAVSVFESQLRALSAMEERRNDLPGIYQPGDSSETGRTWWYTTDELACVYSAYVNVLNTIIEIHYYYDDLAAGKRLVLSTAEILSSRVEQMGR
ncbi:MAG: hypothetical protein U0T82_18095 [Bacteroidales bacterium]